MSIYAKVKLFFSSTRFGHSIKTELEFGTNITAAITFTLDCHYLFAFIRFFLDTRERELILVLMLRK